MQAGNSTETTRVLWCVWKEGSSWEKVKGRKRLGPIQNTCKLSMKIIWAKFLGDVWQNLSIPPSPWLTGQLCSIWHYWVCVGSLSLNLCFWFSDSQNSASLWVHFALFSQSWSSPGFCFPSVLSCSYLAVPCVLVTVTRSGWPRCLCHTLLYVTAYSSHLDVQLRPSNLTFLKLSSSSVLSSNPTKPAFLPCLSKCHQAKSLAVLNSRLSFLSHF